MLAARIPLVVLCVLVSSVAFGQENILNNPSFEDVIDGAPAHWSGRGEDTFELMTDGGHTGDNYIRITDTKPNLGLAIQPTLLPCRPDGVYTATMWMRSSDKTEAGIYVNFFDETGNRVHHLFQRRTGPTEGWVEMTVTAKAPREAMTVGTFIYSYNAAVGVFDADDVTLTVEGGAEPGSYGIQKAEPGEKDMIDIQSRRELFVDDFLVDSLTGDAQRRLHHPVRRNTVVQYSDVPWEGAFCGYATVIRVGDKVRMYYRGWPDLKKGDNTCVIESDDGINFTRPELGLFEWDGNKANNIVWMGEGCHNFSPMLDTNPDAPADQKWKALGGAPLIAFVSPDGLNWTKLREEPVITKGAFDSQNQAFFDELRGEYVEYHRGFKDGVRDIMVTRSKDFVEWSEPEWLSYGDAPSEHLYTNQISAYPRAPHIYIGFPCRFVPGRKKVASHAEQGINDTVLMSSRDGNEFQRWVEAFHRPATDDLAWTDRNNYFALGTIQTSDTELSVYWSEHYRYPTYRMVRGTIRIDGFVSLHGGVPGGEVLTRPFTFAGKQLEINYDTSAIGSVRIELCDEKGDAHPGFSMGEAEMLFGSEITRVLTWSGRDDVSSLAGKPVRMRVRLKDADLYSFKFNE